MYNITDNEDSVERQNAILKYKSAILENKEFMLTGIRKDEVIDKFWIKLERLRREIRKLISIM